MKRLFLAIIVMALIMACSPAVAAPEATPAITQSDVNAAYIDGWQAAMHCVESSLNSSPLPASTSRTSINTVGRMTFENTTHKHAADKIAERLTADCGTPSR